MMRSTLCVYLAALARCAPRSSLATTHACTTPEHAAPSSEGGDDAGLRKELVALARRLSIPNATELMRNARTLKIDANGTPVVLRVAGYDRSPIIQRIERSGINFEETYQLQRLPPLAGAALDIGAHYGTTGIVLATLNPHLTVLAFEPAPVTFLFLCWNVMANGLRGRVIPHNLAFANDSRPLLLDYAPDDSTSTRLQSYGATRTRRNEHVLFSVPVTNFASFLDGCTLLQSTTVAFVKLDCEGCEFAIVPHNQAFFSRVQHLRGEFHACRPPSCTAAPADISLTHATLCKLGQPVNHLVCHAPRRLSSVFDAQRDLEAMPLLGMGTAVKSVKSAHEIGNTMVAFLEAGGRLVDTAPTYGDGKVQRRLGESLVAWPRERPWVISKIPITAMGYESTLRQVNDSLRDLRASQIEMVLVHRACNALGAKGAKQQRVTWQLRLDTWRALLHAQRSGLVRHIGVSNHGIVFLRELAEAGLPPPAVNEVELHPWIDARQWELVRYCRDNGIHVIAYNSLGGLGASRSTPLVAALAAKYGKTEAQILLRWGIEQHATVIPRASSREHIEQNLAAGSFRLTADEVTGISAEPKPSNWASFEESNDPNRIDQGSLRCDTVERLIARHKEALRELARRATADGQPRPGKLTAQVLDAHTWPSDGLCATDVLESMRKLGRFVQRSRHPFIVLPRYFSRESAQVAELRELLHAERAKLYAPSCGASASCTKGMHTCARVPDGSVATSNHTLAERWVPAAGDMRCHMCDSFSPFCATMRMDARLLALATAFYESTGSPQPLSTRPPNVLANAMNGAGASSGGEFHQDEMDDDDAKHAEVTPHQMKCLCYLEDVGAQNGPFTMLVGYNISRMSHAHVPARSILGIEPALRRRDKRSHRFNDDAIASELRGGEAYLVELRAPAGTVICFDSGSIHRGKQIIQGRRSSITLYFSLRPKSPILALGRTLEFPWAK